MSHTWFNEQVERRVREWTLEQERQRAEQALRRPIIALGGDHGALREHVARRVANRLGYGYWDKEILQELAKEGRVPASLLERLDERRVNEWQEAFAGFRPRMGDPRSADYTRILRSFVRGLVTAGGAVIVGRGVRFMVGPNDGFRANVIATMDERVKAIASTLDISDREARRQIEQVDAERADFVRQMFHEDIHELGGLDLIVNSATLGVDGAADTLVEAYQRRFGLEDRRTS